MNWRFIDKHFCAFRDFLEKNHFTIKEELYSPKVFGNAYAVLESQNIEIQLVKDRSIISVDMRGKFEENSKWYGPGSILEFMEHSGRHATKYHEWALEQVEDIAKLAKGNTKKFLELFEKNIAAEVRAKPEMLKKEYWPKVNQGGSK